MTHILRAAVVAALLTATLLLPAGPAAAEGEYVKYWAVPSGADAPRNLTEVAQTVLGDGTRSAELFSLNSGRRQPDGGRLTDPAELRPGWVLVLPWDAHGTGVTYGAVPDRGAAAPPAAAPAGTPTPRPAPAATGSRPAALPPAERVQEAAKLPTSTPAPPPAPKGPCAGTAPAAGKSDWAGLRVAADQAWPHGRGKGQVVAVIDSGADGSRPHFAGHLANGLDMLSGSGRGDVDCLGSGTAMAGIVVAQDTGDGVRGVAPDATVMPVRVVDDDPEAQPADGASAIEAAVAAGATVIALGGYVNTGDPRVIEAIAAAGKKNVLVVLGAPLESAPVAQGTDPGPAILRVAGVGMDNSPVAAYRKGAVDVVAPGVNVAGLGITGIGTVSVSGTSYAVAYVAATAALVRSAYPDLSAEQVARRVSATASATGGTEQDIQTGHGLINPARAVTEQLPDEAQAATQTKDGRAEHVLPGRSGGGQAVLLIVTLVVALITAVLLVLRIRHLVSAGRREPEETGQAEAYDPWATFAPRGDQLPPASVPRAPSVNGNQEPPAPIDPPDAPDTPAEDRAAAGAKSTRSNHD